MSAATAMPANGNDQRPLQRIIQRHFNILHQQIGDDGTRQKHAEIHRVGEDAQRHGEA